ncbi:MAG: hypothetical protein KGZ60_07635 [Truepera sp.]|nr:hypothetical protein [Truepera sp.]
MRAFITVLLLALLVVGLYLSRPSKEYFADYQARRASPELLAQLGLAGGGGFGAAVQGLAEGVMRAALEERTLVQDYLVARVFTVPLPGQDWRVLGVAGQFFTLSQPRPQ